MTLVYVVLHTVKCVHNFQRPIYHAGAPMNAVKLFISLALIAASSVFAADVNFSAANADGSYLVAQVDTRDPVRDRASPRPEVRRDAGVVGNNTNSQSSAKADRPQPVANIGIQQCKGEFALCASSTCKLTGRNITVKIADGKGTKQYPEVVCKCPIITEQIAMQNGVELSGMAGVNEGNMQGSCAVPSPDKIWSLFSPLKYYPQESATPPFSTSNMDKQQFKQFTCKSGAGSNCWSFLCTRDKELTNGARTATCACPASENPLGAPTQNSEFLIGAGSHYGPAQGGQQAACTQYPVSIPNIADYKK